MTVQYVMCWEHHLPILIMSSFHWQWVSHRNHRGNICGVDFIWLLNPNMQREPLKTSWNQAVLAIIKVHILSFSGSILEKFFD